MSVGFTTALVRELMEDRYERWLLNLQRQLARLSLLIVDELGFVPLYPTSPLTSGPRCSDGKGSPGPGWTGSPTTSIYWR